MLLCLCVMFNDVFSIFFFKQKTAYEMRISDWSSDVCSSDLFLMLFIGLLDQWHARAARHMVHPHLAGAERATGGEMLLGDEEQIGRASCRERVCQYV